MDTFKIEPRQSPDGKHTWWALLGMNGEPISVSELLNRSHRNRIVKQLAKASGFEVMPEKKFPTLTTPA